MWRGLWSSDGNSALKRGVIATSIVRVGAVTVAAIRPICVYGVARLL
jgi:hypothetical protein